LVFFDLRTANEIMKTYKCENIDLEISAPSLVGSQQGHFWFPTIHPLGGADILCEVVLSPDVAQGEWPASLYLSRDSGNTWAHATDIDSYGHSSNLRGERELLLMPYETWPLEPGDSRNGAASGTIISMTSNGQVSSERMQMKFLGFPSDIADNPKTGLCLMNNGNILKLSDGSLFTTVYGKYAGDEKCSVWCMTSADGGVTWNYLSLVASWKDTPGATEGPDESTTIRLADDTLMCVYRVGSGRDQLFHKSISADEDRNWSKPEAIPGAWSVQPRLTSIGSLILLAGGRPGLFLWVNADGCGKTWQRISLAAHHNEHSDDPAFHFEKQVCSGEGRADPAQTTSYTGLAAIGPDEAILCYDRLANGWNAAPGPWGNQSAVFAVRIRGEGFD
jgi:hypothetical protein